MGIAAGAVLLLELTGAAVEKWIYARPRRPATDAAEATGRPAADPKAVERTLRLRLAYLAPQGLYIAIDTADNKLYLKRGDKIVLEAVVSCGSGDVLEEPGGGRKWVFDTPRGEYRVQSKLVNPTWIKPDWAFIEEGEKPPSDFTIRIDEDSLGDYALGFGDGFFIHGTLYKRLLGRNVTHGCIRVGDKDLSAIFHAVGLGTRIFIY